MKFSQIQIVPHTNEESCSFVLFFPPKLQNPFFKCKLIQEESKVTNRYPKLGLPTSYVLRWGGVGRVQYGPKATPFTPNRKSPKGLHWVQKVPLVQILMYF